VVSTAYPVASLDDPQELERFLDALIAERNRHKNAENPQGHADCAACDEQTLYNLFHGAHQ
jgi:hypothetical protein